MNACKYIHELQKDALKRSYARKGTDEDGEESDDYDDDLEPDLGEADIEGDE